MKIAAITCYEDPDYVRAVVLRRALANQNNVDLLVCKNKHKGILRYPEVIIKLIWLRLRYRPDVYVITFRGYEILPFAALLSWPKTLIYDELVNPLEWLSEDRKELWVKFIPKKLLSGFYTLLLTRCRYIITDTAEHSSYSSEISKTKLDKFIDIPVGTDEDLFKPMAKTKTNDKLFSVFYYGSMLPLHGFDVVLEAALKLKELAVEFVLVGGGPGAEKQAADYNKMGANVRYINWVPFDQIPTFARRSNLCLGGPFGDSPQAQRVITGKTYQFLACSVPVLIGSNLSTELFVDKKNCLCVPLNDAGAIASQIKWAISHPVELSKIADSGNKLYQKNFSNRSISKRVEKLLYDL